jgi:hypothetical protein
VAYALHPTHLPVLLAADDAPITQRAGFATKHLWVTRYHPDERYSAAGALCLIATCLAGVGPVFATGSAEVATSTSVGVSSYNPLSATATLEELQAQNLAVAAATSTPNGFALAQSGLSSVELHIRLE